MKPNLTCIILFFFALAPNDLGYGLGRAAGEFPVAIATKEMRAQRLQKAHQPPKAHRRVLCVRSFHFKIVYFHLNNQRELPLHFSIL